MKPWTSRPVEVAHLFNPAFCGEVLRRASAAYFDTSGRGLPYPLTFLVLPIVLHRHSRESIPLRVKEPMHAWLKNHQDVRVGFAERARQLVPITKEAVTFLLQVGAVTVGEDAGIQPVSGLVRKFSLGSASDEVEDCFNKAVLVGRWFARAGTPTTIFTMWGVKP